MLRNAKLEAMGKPPMEPKPRHDRPQMATDEIVRLVVFHGRYRTHHIMQVMERFRKRMRK